MTHLVLLLFALVSFSTRATSQDLELRSDRIKPEELEPPLNLVTIAPLASQQAPRTLVAVFAHPDDEGAAAPVLARYAREGVQVYLIIATDGAGGGRRTSVPEGGELARVRSEEARCAAAALGLQPPVILGLPDGQLGNYADDPGRLYSLTQRILDELQRLRPDAIITWGADGGTGHADHRLVSNIVTQLVRAEGSTLTDRVFHAYLPLEAMRAFTPSRGVPPNLYPQAKYFTVRVPFIDADLEAAVRSLECHRTQVPEEVLRPMIAATRRALSASMPFIPLSPAHAGNDLFRVP